MQTTRLAVNNLHLKNGHVVDPANNINGVRDLWIQGSRFIEKDEVKEGSNLEVIDLTGRMILPGFVDLRCHPRNVTGGSTENICSISKTAAQGGYTSILGMPNISPFIDNPGDARYATECAERDAVVKFHLAGALTEKSEGNKLSPIGSLKESGIIAVTDCPYSTQNNEIFVKGVEYAAMFNLPVIDFPRELSLSKYGTAHDSAIALAMGLGGYPRMAEEMFVQRSITVSRNLDVPIHLSSISSKGSVELIHDAKSKGIRITADTTPHHIFFDDRMIKDYDANFKTHPPLREECDQKALLSGLKEGTIDAICTAHEPHQNYLKQAEYDVAPAGVTSLDTCFSAIFTRFFAETKNIAFECAKWLSYNPAKILKIEGGNLGTGMCADFVVINSNQKMIYTQNNTSSLASNNPFYGKDLRSIIEKTFVNGKVIFDNV